MKSEDNLPPLREVLAAHHIHPRKSLGQNFIFDLNLTRRIARESGVEGATVYEVGPGPGGLTRSLLLERAARVIAVERDFRALPALEQIGMAYPGRLAIIANDAVTISEPTELTALGADLPLPVVANLPFNAGTALLVKWLSADWPPWWSRLILMFQKEVAARICAQPAEKAYGRLSVLAQWRSTPRILFHVSPQAFIPPPAVSATVVRIDPLPVPRFPAELHDLERVTTAAFGQRRKMLRSSLRSITADPVSLLADAGISPAQRAEELDVSQFCMLARAFRRRFNPSSD